MTNNKNDKNLMLLNSIKELKYITNTDNLINIDNDKKLAMLKESISVLHLRLWKKQIFINWR